MNTIFPYNFAARGASHLELEQFLTVAAIQFPERDSSAPWELGSARTPEHIEFNNFRFVIPLNKDIREAGVELCGKLIAFAVRFLEKLADHHRLNTGDVPTAEQIIEDLDQLAQKQELNLRHEIWMYVECLRHPIVEIGVTNALNHRWNSGLVETEDYGQFYPAPETQCESIDYSVSFDPEEEEPAAARAASRSRRAARR